MIKPGSSKLYSIVNLNGEVLFLNDAYTTFSNIDRNKVIGKKALDFITITPKIFAIAQALKDRRDILNGKKSLIRREGIIASEKCFAIVTNDKLPLMDAGEVVGVINETDASIEQLVKNRCFLNLKPAYYKGELFGSSDMKILCMLAQFDWAKPSDISEALQLKMNTVYMYRHNLLNKISNVCPSGKYNMVDIAKDIFFKGQTISAQQVVCISGIKYLSRR
ncbi:transcriptional regulator [Piscirickettsia litoralis]|uniref:PAS fold family protein n=1 Tax=Piscirickettsia litoralis TaxID=1891921 RepID=A0ABX3A600_9GAMM|nr:PAS fold family protein [Piscirickettsia litoralis]ODN43657.1 PAS fold family protein [Piscirickettsia litoralis]